jgi:hypothetical protein
MRIYDIQNSFSSGEWSPSMYGRSDLDRYRSAVRELINALPIRQGGVIRSPGTKFIKAAVNQDDRVRLLSFIFDADTNYILEFGDATLRFYRGSGASQGPVLDGMTHFALTSPYSLAQLSAIDYSQQGNVMVLCHPSIHPKRLQRFGETLWTLDDLPIRVYPSIEAGHKPPTTLTLSATTGTITLTAGGNSFLASDVGRQVRAGTGLATITVFTSKTQVTATTVRDFDTTSYASGAWTILDSPLTSLTASATGPEGGSITLTAGAAAWRHTALSDNLSDIGRYVKVNEGIAEITAISSATVATATVRTVLANTTVAPLGTWSLEQRAWSSEFGFPRAVSFFEQRLVFASTAAQPTTLWGSATGDILDFAIGPDGADAFQFTLASGRVDLVQYLESLRSMVALTIGAEHSITGSGGGPVTPTSVQIRAHSFYGTTAVKPVKIGYELVYSQFSSRKLRTLLYDFGTDSYQGDDLSLFAEHLIDDGVVRMTYAQEPHSVFWIVTNDGHLRSMTYDPDNQVQMLAWAQHPGNGVYLDLTSVPSPTGDVTWLLTRRSIDGTDQWFIEAQNYSLNTHAAVVQTGSAFTVVTGLSHLDGQEVDIVADGTPQPRQTVAGGQITLVREADTAEVGLPYVSRIVPLPVEFSQNGSSQGRHASINEVILRVRDTAPMYVNGNVMKGWDFGEMAFGQPPPRVTGDFYLSKLGWMKSQQNQQGETLLEITQEQPLSFHILALIRQITVN